MFAVRETTAADKSPEAGRQYLRDTFGQGYWTKREGLQRLPAYQDLAHVRDDGGCGAAMLAGSSVAVPFVSAVAGAFAIAQAIRIASAQAHHISIAGDVCDLRSVRVVLGKTPGRITVPNIKATSSGLLI